MERSSSHRSKRTDTSRKEGEDSRKSALSERESSRHQNRDRLEQKTSSANHGRRVSRTAPSSPEPRHRAEVSRSHSTDRPSPRRQESQVASPSQSRQHSRREDRSHEKKCRERDERSGGDGARAAKSSRDRRSEDPDLKERQLNVYQKALKEQIVQSDHLIKAVYRFSDCIDMTEKAMRNLHDVMGDYWEDDWPGAEKYYVTLQDQEELWDRYEQSMRKLLDPIREYEDQFESAEDKIEEYHDIRRQYSQACATLEELRRRRATGHDITFAESDRDRIGKQYEELVSFLSHGLPKIIASRIPFMEKLFYQLSNNLLQFCLETCKVQSKSCQIISKMRSHDLTVTLGEGRSRTVIRAPAREPAGAGRSKSASALRAGKDSRSPRRRN